VIVNLTKEQKRNLVLDYLRLNNGAYLNAIGAAMGIQKHWGIHIDWHEFSTMLDTLKQNKKATLEMIDSNGSCWYTLNM
jgi:hypothetical protein